MTKSYTSEHRADELDRSPWRAFVIDQRRRADTFSEQELRDFDVTKRPVGINLKGTGPLASSEMLSSYHPATVHALMIDGSVRTFSQSTDQTVLKRLTTVAEHEQPD